MPAVISSCCLRQLELTPWKETVYQGKKGLERGRGKGKRGKKIKFHLKSKHGLDCMLALMSSSSPRECWQTSSLLKQQSDADLLFVYTIQGWIIYSNRAVHWDIKAKMHFRRGCLWLLRKAPHCCVSYK